MHGHLKKLHVTVISDAHYIAHPSPSCLSLLRGHRYPGSGFPHSFSCVL